MAQEHTVCLVGLGYMGLPTALLIAKAGVKVIGYDVVKEKVDMLNNGKLPFEEEGLQELYNAARLNFKAINKLTKDAVKKVDAYIISVPTPFASMKKCDLSYVISATQAVMHVLKKNDLVVLESTVSPGTTVDVIKPLLEKSGLKFGKDFYLAYVSEKAIPGNTIYEMVNNARIMGGVDWQSTVKAKEIYHLFVKGELILTNSTTSEMTKLVENTYRDVNIAFANELARLSESFGVNVWEVIQYANKHPRVKIHSPGPGVGGHCIAIDPWFLLGKGSSDLIWTARNVNDSMPKHVFFRLRDIALQHNMKTPKIAILGVAYKKNVDDPRETPAEPLIEMCISNGWEVSIHDPHVKKFSMPLVKDVKEVIKDADIVVIVTDHDEYKDVDLTKKIVLDTRNMDIKAKEYYLLGYHGALNDRSIDKAVKK